jgi:PadR family transcriptional regulator, regulatory protein PadR
MAGQRSSPDFLNGVPELLILQLLDRKPRHGYELVQVIREATTSVLAFGEGCVYPILHRLEDAGDLASRREEVAGRSRVVYRVTKRGKRKLAAATAEWQTIADAIQRVIKGGSHGRPEPA